MRIPLSPCLSRSPLQDRPHRGTILEKLAIASRELHCNAYRLEDGDNMIRESYETLHTRCSEALEVEVAEIQTLT